MSDDLTDDVTYDVAIAGYGPVGNALAILLAQLGRSVVVLERYAEPYPLPRAVHFDHEVGRILQACGLGDVLPGLIEPAEVYEWRNATGVTLLRFGRIGPGSSGWPQSSMFNQPALERCLDERAQALGGIEVRRGVDVIGLDQDDDGVTLHHRLSTGETGSVRARYVVGCDGANSTVRGLLGVPVRDLGFFYDWLIVDVVLHDERVFDPINLQICDPARPMTAVSGGPGRRRWEFMRLPQEDIDDLNDEAAAWRFLEPWDVTPANATLERHAVYSFQARWVELWRLGRVLLAGDAAHQMPPFAGQGLCSGLRDAANLAWKLALVLDGRAGPALLDTYAVERMPNVQGVIEFSMELGKVICVPDPAEAEARDAAMTAGVVDGELMDVPELPGLLAGLIAEGSPHAGELFVQSMVTDHGGAARFDDVVGVGWRVVSRGDVVVELEADLATWFAGLGGRVVGVGERGDLGDPDGAYARWFADHDVAVAVQRPDFSLFGTASDATGARRLLTQLRASLTAVEAAR